MRNSVAALFLGSLLIFSHQSSQAADLKLNGFVRQLNLGQNNDFEQPATDTTEPAGKIALAPRIPVEQPDWIQARVYSGDEMVMRVSKRNFLIASQRSPAEIPTHSSSSITLKPTVLANWHGGSAPNPCVVTCKPFGPKGNFKFKHKDKDGPSGYLERVGKDQEGFTHYRYWFNETRNDIAESVL